MDSKNFRQVSALEVEIEISDVPAEILRAGAPKSGLKRLGNYANASVGIWEMTPGVTEETEISEIFIVIEGAASIEFLDSGESIDISSGDIVTLAEGERTIWTVTETIRKVYLSANGT